MSSWDREIELKSVSLTAKSRLERSVLKLLQSSIRYEIGYLYGCSVLILLTIRVRCSLPELHSLWLQWRQKRYALYMCVNFQI